MNLKKMRIGLALSGGGIRASIFHLGVLQYLAKAGLFRNIANLSSVSGASLTVGLIFAVSGNKWPMTDEFIHHVQPKVRKLILENCIQTSALRRLPFSPLHWHNRVKLIAKMLEEKWGITGNLQDLPMHPFWEINCTTFETGRNFRIRRDYMGDPVIGYVQNPKLPISHMIAASAAFPVLIGPYVLKTEGMRWTQDKKGHQSEIIANDYYTLWDGGVYDNLGLDPLFKIGRGLARELDEEIDFLIVSNAGAPIHNQKHRGHISISNLRRLLDIATDQVGALRSQQVYSSIVAKNKGMYLKMGLTCEQIATAYANIHESELFVGRHGLHIDEEFTKKHLLSDDTVKVRNYPTTLNSPTAADFDLIFRHGYEIAECVHRFYVC